MEPAPPPRRSAGGLGPNGRDPDPRDTAGQADPGIREHAESDALIYPFVLLYLNSKLPRVARPSWWQYAVLLIAVVFSGFFFINFVVEFFTGEALVAF